MRSIAILGGTFDPVHLGHIQASINIQKVFNFDHYFFLPCATPVHKKATVATSQQRIAMLELAIKDQSDFALDLREIRRDTPSYMVDTLKSFRTDYPEDSITLIVGYDAFLSLPTWHQWNKLIELANLLVINRKPFAKNTVPTALQRMLVQHRTTAINELLHHKTGIIYMFDAGNFDISSTCVREELKHVQAAAKGLPERVNEYIKKWKLYQ